MAENLPECTLVMLKHKGVGLPPIRVAHIQTHFYEHGFIKRFLVLFLNVNFVFPMYNSLHQCSAFASCIHCPLSVCIGYHRNSSQETGGECGDLLTSLMSLWYLLFISSVLMSSFLAVSASCSTSPTREDSAAKRSFICAIS